MCSEIMIQHSSLKQLMNKFCLSLLLVFLLGCANDTSNSDLSSSGLNTQEIKLPFVNELIDSPNLNIINYLYYYNGGGVAIGDVDNDGKEDIFLTANQGSDRLLKNTGALNFDDITESSGIEMETTWSTGVSMADVNNDGFLDVYVCKVGVDPLPAAHNLLYINQKDGTFVESSAAYGLDFSGYSTQAVFLDYDKDGDLDMYLCNHNVHSVRSYGTVKKRKEKDSVAGDQFFENRLMQGETGFINVTESTRIYSSPLGYGLSVAAADINGDGWTDIYVGNDFHENDYLYINNQNKTFTESISAFANTSSQFSMGVDIADINNDQLSDIFTTDMLPYQEEIYLKSGGEDTDQIKRIKKDFGFETQNARNHFHINSAQGYLTDCAYETNTFATDWSWSVLAQDFDNNGWKDIFITNGIVKRPNDLDYINFLNSEAISSLTEGDEERTKKLIEKLPSQKLKNILFSQSQEMNFSEVNNSEVGSPTFSNGAAYADLNSDGVLEVVVNNINDQACILSFSQSEAANYLSLQLNHSEHKPMLGSKVYLYAGEVIQFQELQTVKGFQSSSSSLVHFGLGDINSVDSIKIIWPDQSVEVRSDLEINKVHSIYKSDSANVIVPLVVKNKGEAQKLELVHVEDIFNDDEKEKLIPFRLSAEGPAVIYEDLDGDGIKDMFLGAAKDQKASLLRGKRDGGFEKLENISLDRDAKYEDVSAATLDFDNDGDLDIYVVSGGNHVNELDKLLEDRIYLNNGEMSFRRIPLSLPHTNGSVVRTMDFDKDGYDDIFVGARSMPGFYGLSPYSFVLKNRQGVAVDIAYKQRLGMITDASWGDIDGDDDEDLIYCGDWMSISMLENVDGELKMKMPDGLKGMQGFWNALKLVDLNKDGKLDIVAGNIGNNTILQADSISAIKMYLGDFNENGTSEPLIFYKYFDRYIPLGSKDKLVSELPQLKKKFAVYNTFAQVEKFEELLPDGPEKLIESKQVNQMKSMIFLQEEAGFSKQALPELVQQSKVQAIEFDESSGSLYFLFNGYESVASLGSSPGHSGIRIGGYSEVDGSFSEEEILNLPPGLNARALLQTTEGDFYVICNNDHVYFLVRS